MPAHDGVGLDDDERIGPAAPQRAKHDPEGAIGRGQTRSLLPPGPDGELLSQGEVLEHEALAIREEAPQQGVASRAWFGLRSGAAILASLKDRRTDRVEAAV